VAFRSQGTFEWVPAMACRRACVDPLGRDEWCPVGDAMESTRVSGGARVYL
jgi:hypothetical protein